MGCDAEADRHVERRTETQIRESDIEGACRRARWKWLFRLPSVFRHQSRASPLNDEIMSSWCESLKEVATWPRSSTTSLTR